MSEIAVLIPALGRPGRAQPVVDSAAEATSVPHRVYFLCSPGDTSEIEACRATGAEVIVVGWNPGPGDYARKINAGYRLTEEPFIFCGADDLHFHVKWDETALQVAKDTGAGVIGTNDDANPAVKRGWHSTHPLVRRAYVEEFGSGTFDATGEIYCERYDHQYVDNELVATAQYRKRWAFARHSVVKHLHPLWGTAPMDATYRKALRGGKSDQDLFNERMRVFGRSNRVNKRITTRMGAK